MVVTTAGNQARPSEGTVRPVGGGGRIETAQQLAQALRIVQVEPAHHCLKSRGPPIGGRIKVPGTATGRIATPPDPLQFLIPQQGFELLKGQALGFCPDSGHTGGMETPGAGRPTHQQLALVQLPDGIPEPGQLGRARAGLRRR